MTQGPHGAVLLTVLDTDVLAELRSMSEPGDDSLLHDVIKAFLKDVPERFALLDAAYAAAAIDAVRHEAHALKGSAAAVGAVRMASVSSAMEQAARSQSLEAAAEHCSDLRREFEAARQALEAVC